jgi:hypothetical protein
MNRDLTPKELAESYLRQLRGEDFASAAESFDAADILEDLICDEPENAWPVFLKLLARPHDDDTLEDIKSWLEFLLRRHYDAFHERVKELAQGHDQLPRFLPDEALEREQFEEAEAKDDEIVDSYLEHYRYIEQRIRIDQLIADDPDRALPLLLEIIHRGQNYNFESYDLFSPLWDLLRRHGEAIIDRIEREALSSVILRRCLWKMKLWQENAPPQFRIAEEVWRRVKQAAGETNDYNSALPSEARPNPLPEESEKLLASWFAYKQTDWASAAVYDLTYHDPNRLWTIIKALVAAAPDENALSYIGAGPLEDLLSKYGERFIELIEQQAAVDAKFRFCLAGAWQNRMSDELWQRVTTAVGDRDRY